MKEILKNKNNSNDEENTVDDKEEINLTDLRNLSDLNTDTWNKIEDVLENLEYNNDIFLKYFIEEFSGIITDKEGNELGNILKDDSIYKIIIRTFIDMCSKASYTDHFKLLFDKPKEEEKEKKEEKKEITLEDLLNKYETICMIEWEKPISEIITCEYVRPRRKKNVPASDLENDFIQVKANQNNPESHNVLLYDGKSKFFLRNKVF